MDTGRQGLQEWHAVYKAFLRLHPHHVPVEETGVCTPIGNRETMLAAVYESPGRIWSVADVTGLLNYRNECIFAGNLNAAHTPWNSKKKVKLSP
jgi:hypothetical protein